MSRHKTPTFPLINTKWIRRSDGIEVTVYHRCYVTARVEYIVDRDLTVWDCPLKSWARRFKPAHSPEKKQ